VRVVGPTAPRVWSADQWWRPPSALRVVPRPLPASTDAFTGRDAALKALDGLLDGQETGGDRPVVVGVIAGTAGVGKTIPRQESACVPA
jgi:hypothetical protein